MDIDQKLRELLVLQDPGMRFTDAVMARVGDAPVVAGDGVVRLNDARARKRGRRILLGALVVVAAAASMVPLVQRRGDAPAVPQAVAARVDAAVPEGSVVPLPAAPRAQGPDPRDCIDPDVLRGLLLPLPDMKFGIGSLPPRELSDFKPPRQLALMGFTTRESGQVAESSVVYRTGLAVDAARAAAGGAMASDGWMLHADSRPFGPNVFKATNQPLVDTYCRDGAQAGVTASRLDGVNYVVVSVARTGGAPDAITACDQPAQVVQRASGLDSYMPELELPLDPETGQPVRMHGGGGGSGDVKRRMNVRFVAKDSVDGVARHFAAQMAAQGWSSGTSWSGTGTAGSTWTRQLDAGTQLQGVLMVSAFAQDRFTAVFHVVQTK